MAIKPVCATPPLPVNRSSLHFFQTINQIQSLEITTPEKSPFIIEITDSNNLPENFLINQEITECMMAVIDNLPKNMQKTAFMYLIEKLPLDTIAKHLICPTGTIRSRTFRIRKHICKFLADLEQRQKKS